MSLYFYDIEEKTTRREGEKKKIFSKRKRTVSWILLVLSLLDEV